MAKRSLSRGGSFLSRSLFFFIWWEREEVGDSRWGPRDDEHERTLLVYYYYYFSFFSLSSYSFTFFGKTPFRSPPPVLFIAREGGRVHHGIPPRETAATPPLGTWAPGHLRVAALQGLGVLAVLLVEADGGELCGESLDLVLEGVNLGELPPGGVSQRVPETRGSATSPIGSNTIDSFARLASRASRTRFYVCSLGC